MEVILLEKIRGLGSLGETVKVKPGYGRNFLVPTGKAVYATKSNIEKFEVRRAELEQKAAEQLQAAEQEKERLMALGTIVIPAKAGEEGKLFGSISTRDIATAISEKGVEISKSQIHLPTGLLRQIGEYEVDVELHSDVNAKVKVNIVQEN